MPIQGWAPAKVRLLVATPATAPQFVWGMPAGDLSPASSPAVYPAHGCRCRRPLSSVYGELSTCPTDNACGRFSNSYHGRYRSVWSHHASEGISAASSCTSAPPASAQLCLIRSIKTFKLWSFLLSIAISCSVLVLKRPRLWDKSDNCFDRFWSSACRLLLSLCSASFTLCSRSFFSSLRSTSRSGIF